MTALDGKVRARATALVGYKAVVDHAIEHGLPAPESIELTDTHLRIWLLQGGGQWVESIHIDQTVTEPVPGWDRERIYITGRLPLLGIKVQLRFSRPAVAAVSHLMAVGS